MIFFPLDSKRGCDLIYNRGRLIKKNELSPSEKMIWNYSESLPRQKYLYASLYFPGKSIHDNSPSHLLHDYDHYYKKLLSHYKSFATAKVNLEENCFFDLVPESFLLGLYSEKEKILKQSLLYSERPNDYEILSKIHEICTIISNQELVGLPVKIKYNMFGTKTGRLSTHKGSFPILNMKKGDRSLLRPKNDLFVELDFNGAEIRTLLALSDKKQPDLDIHEWNMTRMNNVTTRPDAKEKFFAWFYNPASRDRHLEKIYDKSMFHKYYDGTKIKTPFGRELEVDESKALNYLLQSTTSDLVLENAHKLSLIHI